MLKLRRISIVEKYILESKDLTLEAKKDLDDLKDHLGEDLFNDYMKIRDKINDPEYKDFGKLKKLPVKDIQEYIDNFQSESDKRKEAKKGAKKLYEDSDWIVYKITTYPAAQYYGKNTKWCITGRYHGHEEQGEEYFYKYIKDANLDGGYYFYISKKNPKEKYCVLQTKDKQINSIWDPGDNQRGSSLSELKVDLPKVKEVNLEKYTVDGLRRVVRNFNTSRVKEYFENGFNSNTIVNDLGESVFSYALSRYIDASPNYSDYEKKEALDFFKFLLENGADPNQKNYINYLYDDPDMINLLLTYGVDPNTCNTYGESLLENIKNLDTVKVLLEHGADPDTPFHSDFYTVLAHAASTHDLDKAKLLLEYGADPNKVLESAPLHEAVRSNNVKMVNLLIDHGADVNLKDADGRTPIMSIYYENAATIKILLEHGADPNIKTSDGLTALKLAARYRNNKIIDLLKEYGATE